MWKPIETAPKDGTHVLLYVEHDGVIEGWWDATGYRPSWSYLTLDIHGCGCCCGSGDNPTHWMPLPAKPEGE